MVFQNPSAWYLLPIALLPLVLNLYLINRRRTKLLPSLYFYHQLVKRKQVVFRHLRWLLLLLETLFLLGIVIMFARPVVPTLSDNKSKLMVLLDDSLSMSYYFQLDDNQYHNQLYIWLKKYFSTTADKDRPSVEIKKLSEINQFGTITINNLEALDRYFELLKLSDKGWRAGQVKSFFKKMGIENDYNFILYSDFKANHFEKKGLSELIPDDFNASIFLLGEEGAPALSKLSLLRRNYFVQEKLNLNLSLVHQQDFSLEVLFNNNLIFNKKYNELNKENKAALVNEVISIPLAESVRKKDNNEKSRQALAVLLKKNGEVYQSYSEPFYLFKNKKIGVPSGSEDYFNFVKSLFAYDVKRGHVSLQKVSNNKSLKLDTSFVLFPFEGGSRTTSQLNNGVDQVVFISPNASLLEANKWLWQNKITGLELRDKRYFKSSDRMLFRRFDGTLNQKKFELKTIGELGVDLSLERYFTVVPYNDYSVDFYPILSVNDEPIIFIYDQVLFFNLFRPYDLLEKLNFHYLSWIYEGIFSLWRNDFISEDSDLFMNTSKNLLLETSASKLENIEEGGPNVRWIWLSRDVNFEQKDIESENFLEVVEVIIVILFLILIATVYFLRQQVLENHQLEK